MKSPDQEKFDDSVRKAVGASSKKKGPEHKAEVKPLGGEVSSSLLDKHHSTISKVEKIAADANAAVKSAWADARKDGIDIHAFKVVREHIGSTADTIDHKATVNIYMTQMGQLPLYAEKNDATKH